MAVASALQRSGWDVFVPLFAAHARVDLVIAGPAGLLRVQCKTSRVDRGAVVFRTCSNTANVPIDYRDQVDAFGVFSPERNEVYLVPIGALGIRGCSLRVDPPRNGQVSGVRWAAVFLVGRP